MRRRIVSFVDFAHHVFEVATHMGKECAEWQVLKQLVHKGIVQLEDREDDDASCIAHHGLIVVEELACDGQQREVIRPLVHEELDRVAVNA